MKRLIVGVDPGVTVGLAALSLDGVPVLVESRRSWALSDLIKTVTELGEPTIVSSDVSPAPELLERLSNKLNAVLFTPLISFGADEKRQIARACAERFGFKLENNHEVDALAAAAKAYQHYARKFEQVETRVNQQDLKIPGDSIKDLIVRGHTFKRAVQLLQSPKEMKAPLAIKRTIPREEQMKRLVQELKERLAREKERAKRLKATNQELRLKIKALEAERASLNEKIDQVRSDQSAQVRREREYQLLLDEAKTVRVKLSEVSALLEGYRNRFDEMQRLRELESQGKMTLLKPIEAFSENGLRKAFQLYNVKAGDCVSLLDPSGGGAATAETLAKRGVRAVVAKGSMSHQAMEVFAKHMVPIVSSEKLKIEWIEGLPYVDSESMRKAVKEAEEKEVSKAYEEVKSLLENHKKELGEEAPSF